MAEDQQDEIDSLKSTVCKLSKGVDDLQRCLKCTGGMQSDAALRDIIIEERVDEYLALFKRRQWEELDTQFPNRRMGLVIKPFNQLNFTPFSYDLSVGDELFSVQRNRFHRFEGQEAYRLEPGETVVIATRELVAISRYHSATVWPRFNLVRRGVLQSMVKIDPTWFGKLAVVVSNTSPAEIPFGGGARLRPSFYTVCPSPATWTFGT